MRTIFHPTDFSPASGVAFLHALRLAQLSRSDLIVFHAAPRAAAGAASDADTGARFPRVRAPLEAWGLLPRGSRPADVARLGFTVRKVELVGDDAAATARDYLEGRAVDLLVLAAPRPGGDRQRGRRAVSDTLVRHAATQALLLPPGTAGFVAPETGAIDLERVVVRLDETAAARDAITATAELVRALGCHRVDVTLLAVGDHDPQPDIDLPSRSACVWTRETGAGGDAAALLAAADTRQADLIVTATNGPDGAVGPAAEAVVGAARCPVLVVPGDA